MQKNRAQKNRVQKSKIGHLAGKAVKAVLLVLLSIMVGFSLYMANAELIGGNQMPMPFGYGMAVVLSGSMEPAFSVDDIVIVKAGQDAAVNDIVVYRDGNSLTVHRVINTGDGVIVTKGDANNAADQPVDTELVLGKVILIIPKAGIVVKAVRTPVGTLLMILAAVFLMEVSFRRDKKEKDQEIRELEDEIRTMKEEINAEKKG